MTFKQFLLTMAAALAVAAVTGSVSASQLTEFRAGKNEAEHASFKDCVLEIKADLRETKLNTQRIREAVIRLEARK